MGRPALGEEAPGPLGTPCPHGRARGSGCGLYPGCGAACAERDAATAGDCVRGAQGLAAASDKHLITDRRRAERGARHGRTLCVTLCARPPGWALWRQGPGRPRPGVTGRGRGGGGPDWKGRRERARWPTWSLSRGQGRRAFVQTHPLDAQSGGDRLRAPQPACRPGCCGAVTTREEGCPRLRPGRPAPRQLLERNENVCHQDEPARESHRSFIHNCERWRPPRCWRTGGRTHGGWTRRRWCVQNARHTPGGVGHRGTRGRRRTGVAAL